MNPWLWSALTAGLIMTAGCQSHPLFDPPLSEAPIPRLSAVPPGRIAGSSTDRNAAPPQPTGDLSLSDVLSFALSHSPRLAAYATEIRIAQARAMQADRWPNPDLDVEIENVAGSGRFSGFDAAETTLSLAQTFPLGKDIDRRRELADTRTQLANWDYEAARLAVLLDATRRFIEALAADRRIELAERELTLALATQELTVRRVEAGDASPLEEARVVVPVVTAEVALKRAQRERDAAYQRVAMTWGGRVVMFDRVVGAMERLDSLPRIDTLIQLVNENPDVARWAAQISRRLAERRLAKAEAVSDLTGRIGVKHHNEDEDVALVVGISLPLSVFDHRRGDILAARLGAVAARQQQHEAELRLEGMLGAIYAELAGSYDEATALKARAIPAATDAYDATRRAFDEGALPFLDVLDAQRSLFDLQARYVDALVRYHTAIAEIESLIGCRLADLSQPQSRQENQP